MADVTALFAAAKSGPSSSLNVPLLNAAKAGDCEALKDALNAGADVNCAGSWDGNSPLHWAVEKGHVECARVLCQRGAKVNARERWQSWTPLMVAASKNRVAEAALLLEHGADLSASARGRTAVEHAASDEMLAMLRSANAPEALGAGVCVQRLRADAASLASPLQDALAAFSEELRGICTTKAARASITMVPAEEAELWLKQEGIESELCTFVVHRNAAIHALVCASICRRGEHTRHRAGGPPVAFVHERKRRRSNECKPPEVIADVMVWHLWVSKSARHQGLATRLLAAVLQHARRDTSGLPCGAVVRVSADVLVTNATALAFWRRALPACIEEPGEDWLRLSSVL